MKSILVLTCLCFIGVPMVYGASKRVLDFISFVSGNFDNKIQTQQPGDDHVFIQSRIVPMDSKCFPSASEFGSVIFGEEAANNVLQLIYLMVVTDGIEDTVSVALYNLTIDLTKYKPREFKVESLANIPCGDLPTNQECNGSYIVAKGFVYGNAPFCRVTVNGIHPRFTSLHTCDAVTITMPQYSQATSPMEPYELIRTDKKYPMVNPPPGYVSPCGN